MRKAGLSFRDIVGREIVVLELFKNVTNDILDFLVYESHITASV